MLSQKSLKSYYNTAKRAYPYLKQGYDMYSKYRKLTQRRTTKKKGTSNYGVTNQHDVQVQYRKKRMPRKKRLRWKRFVKKVEAIADKGLGTKTRLYNIGQEATNANGKQGVQVVHLYSKFGQNFGASEQCNLDLANIVGAYGTNAPFKVKFKSAVLDITATNVGINFAAGPPIEVDVYHVMYRGDPKITSLTGAINDACARTNNITGSGTLNFTERGVTLFDVPAAISATNMKIIKKTKFFVPFQGTFTYQIRDPKNRILNNEDITENQPSPVPTNSLIMPGWTQSLVIVHKPVAGYGANLVTLSVGVTRKYNYRIDTDSFTEDGYN